MDLPVGISTLQNTDRWIGVPLCAILTFFRKILDRGRPTEPCQPRRILFVKFAEQGSTVLAYPAIRHATEMVGRANVYFVVFEDNRLILDVMEIIPEENVITIPISSPWALALGAVRAVLRVEKTCYRCSDRHGISDALFRDADLHDRCEITRRLSYFFW